MLLLPQLVLAEEGLWRGLLLSALLERGMAPAWAVILSTLGFRAQSPGGGPAGPG